jgi:SOS response regulatory protein OraA/RecX
MNRRRSHDSLPTRPVPRSEASSKASPKASPKAGHEPSNEAVFDAPGPVAIDSDLPPRGSRHKPAREKLMDYLARRLHSELELRTKLAKSEIYSGDEIEAAIAFAKESNWMMPPEEISERVSIEMGRKRKGHRFINQFLKTKGLPPIEKDPDEELRKAAAVLVKMSQPPARPRRAAGWAGLAKSFEESLQERLQAQKERQKLQRLLLNRGFDEDTIRRAVENFVSAQDE